jgi:hypothetical protein
MTDISRNNDNNNVPTFGKTEGYEHIKVTNHWNECSQSTLQFKSFSKQRAKIVSYAIRVMIWKLFKDFELNKR